MDAAIDPATGLPVDLLDFAPDTSVYEAMVAGGPPAWLDELRLDTGGAHHHMGTHATTLDGWLLADEARDMELALRSRLLDERRDVVHACPAGAEPVAAATLELVVDWLDEHGIPYDPPDPAEPPLVAAGRLVQEDLCLMIHRDGAWHLDAGVLCFPTLWDLRDRLGLATPDVHERVAHYDEIEQRVDRFFDRLPADRVVWRRNFSVKPYPHLHVPVVKSELPTGAHSVGADGSPYWLRSERQTVRRLTDHPAIVFAIRVQTVPAGVLRERPDIAAALGAHLRGLDAELSDYKFAGSDLHVAFTGWLDEIAADR